jgi:hypothetical protein
MVFVTLAKAARACSIDLLSGTRPRSANIFAKPGSIILTWYGLRPLSSNIVRCAYAIGVAGLADFPLRGLLSDAGKASTSMAKTRVIVTPGGIGEIEGNRARLGHIRRPIPSGVVKPPSTVSSQTSPPDLMIGFSATTGSVLLYSGNGSRLGPGSGCLSRGSRWTNAAPGGCCITCASSWARSRRPAGVPGA